MKIFLFFTTLLLSSNCCNAQTNIVSTGANATNQDGSISYSIGQIDYISSSNSTTLINQGVQQPFEIVTLSGHDIKDIQLVAEVYPNPSVNHLIIAIHNYDLNNMNYELLDIRGRKISDGKITTNETTVDMQQYAAATYVVKLTSNNKEIKTFKIIKKD